MKKELELREDPLTRLQVRNFSTQERTEIAYLSWRPYFL